ncbi:erythropoietin b [Salminus brasiliensis]|uniref:erythropoietin b n=1 Tax=Salminus brasiliensis TaxID=930266 RepID=UPI003B82D385
MPSASGLVNVVLTVLMWTAGCQASPLRAVCDPRVLERFLREARDTEAAMRSCGGSCGVMGVYTVPVTNVDFTDWEQKDAEGQVAEVQAGLSLVVQALQAVRETVSSSPLSGLLDNNISNIHSLIHIIHSLSSQARPSAHPGPLARTQTHSPSELLHVQTNFLRGKVKLLLSAACRTLGS